MLSYRSVHGKTHIVDETSVTHLQTLCGRRISEERADFIEESDRAPECRVCGSALACLKRPEPAPPTTAVTLPDAVAGDLVCPICHRPMKLRMRRLSLPSPNSPAVQVTMMLICTNEPGHQEKP